MCLLSNFQVYNDRRNLRTALEDHILGGNIALMKLLDVRVNATPGVSIQTVTNRLHAPRSRVPPARLSGAQWSAHFKRGSDRPVSRWLHRSVRLLDVRANTSPGVPIQTNVLELRARVVLAKLPGVKRLTHFKSSSSRPGSGGLHSSDRLAGLMYIKTGRLKSYTT